MNVSMLDNSTIVAPATPEGESAIALIRLSGPQALSIGDVLFQGKKKLSEAKTHTLHFGRIVDGEQLIDEVLVSVFRGPRTYTGEDMLEISCHGSRYIVQEILRLCRQAGAEGAQPGEFTRRAFLHGKLDLSQAESVADLIAAESKVQHEMAFRQMRGGYSERLQQLRNELIEFAGLIELELDFSEEDVEFADREKFFALIRRLQLEVSQLIESFALGNVLKQGIPVAIIGEPNVGKSTLLNALLNEEKAMVSELAGTTRDFIEDTIHLDGILFRFIDTAGIRETSDRLEAMGIERSFQKLKTARFILYLCDIRKNFRDIAQEVKQLPLDAGQSCWVLLNKSDQLGDCDAYDIEEAVSTLCGYPALALSAARGRNLDTLKKKLVEVVHQEKLRHNGMMVTNVRHLEALEKTLLSLRQIEAGLQQGLSGDLLSVDIRMALFSLGEITGAVEVDRDILGTIFGKFCIGK